MKKIMVILACVAMLFSFASCDNNAASGPAVDANMMAADVLKQFVDASGEVSGVGLYDAINGAATTATGAQAAATDKASATKTVDVADLSLTDNNVKVTGGSLTFTLNTEGKDSKAIASASVSGKIEFTNLSNYAKHTMDINGGVTLGAGTLTLSGTGAELKGTIADVDGISLSQGLNVSIDGNGTDIATVYAYIDPDFKSYEAANVESFVGTVATALETVVKTTGAKSVSATQIVFESAELVPDSGVKAAITIKGTTAEHAFTYESATIAPITINGVTLNLDNATVTVASFAPTLDGEDDAIATAASSATVTISGTVSMAGYTFEI